MIAAVVALLIALMLRMSSFFMPLSKHFFRRQAEQCRRVENVISHELVNRHVNVSYVKVNQFEQSKYFVIYLIIIRIATEKRYEREKKNKFPFETVAIHPFR